MMDTNQTEALTALGHPGRLAVFRLLARRAPDGVRASAIAEALDLRPNTLSVYVKTLAKSGLVTSQRVGTSVYYRANFDRTRDLVDFLVSDCCRGRPELCASLIVPETNGTRPDETATSRFNVLFLCTGNSGRSILAEAILASASKARFRVFSAGIDIASAPEPLALAVLQDMGHDTAGLMPKGVEMFHAADAPVMDFVFTVCNQAANCDTRPFPGHPLSTHWNTLDPSAAEGSEAERRLAFAETYRSMKARIDAFVSLSLESMDRADIQSRIDAIGEVPLRPDF